MNTARLFTTAAFAVALVSPVAVWAQASQPSAAESAAPVNPPAVSATGAGVPATVTRDPNAALGSTSNPIPMSSPTPASDAAALVAGDPTVVSNGPVPDTKANRARYGQPLSATGRATKPAGN